MIMPSLWSALLRYTTEKGILESGGSGIYYHWATDSEDEINHLDILSCSGVIRKISRSKGMRTRTDRTRKGSGLGQAHKEERTITSIIARGLYIRVGRKKKAKCLFHTLNFLNGGSGGNCIAFLWASGKKEVHGLTEGNRGWSFVYPFFFRLTDTYEILDGPMMEYRLCLPYLFSTMSNLSVPPRFVVGKRDDVEFLRQCIIQPREFLPQAVRLKQRKEGRERKTRERRRAHSAAVAKSLSQYSTKKKNPPVQAFAQAGQPASTKENVPPILATEVVSACRGFQGQSLSLGHPKGKRNT